MKFEDPTLKIYIPGKFPGQNDMSKAGRQSPHLWAEMKRYHTGRVADMAALRARQAGLKAPIQCASFRFTYIEPDRRRDPDNIAAAKKFILDGLVKAGVLAEDKHKNVHHWTESFGFSKRDGGGVLVEIYAREPSL